LAAANRAGAGTSPAKARNSRADAEGLKDMDVNYNEVETGRAQSVKNGIAGGAFAEFSNRF
jgi:hypothetical protein